MIPVDSFFDTYVDQLQQVGPSVSQNQLQQQQQQQQGYSTNPGMLNLATQGINLGSSQGAGVGRAGMHQVGGVSSNVMMYGNNKNNQQTQFYTYQQQQPLVQQNIASTGFTGYGEQGAQNHMVGIDVSGQTPFMQQQDTSFFGNAAGAFPQDVKPQPHTLQQQYQSPQQNLSNSGGGGGGGEVMNVNQKQHDSSDEEENSNDKNSSGSKPRRVRNRTPKQQAMNKQAQQRYRERKKSKAINMERTVEALSVEVQALRAVRDQKTQLEDKAAELEQKLLEKEAELNRLQAEIHNHMKGGSTVVGDGSSNNNNNNSESTADNVQFDIQKEVEHLASQFHAQVAVLRNLVKTVGIENGDTTDIYGNGLDANALKGVEQLVMDICMVCMRSLRMEGANVWSMIQATLQTTPNPERVWNSTSAAQRLLLTDQQKHRALALRKDYLKKLKDIYFERQGLNLQAISVLLPQDQGGQGPNLKQNTTSYSITGFFARARHNGRMNSVLEQLRENLRAEQRAASELDYIVFHRLLTPIQASWFVLECYPEHCDCLELLNGCDQAFGQDINMC
eukprot:TRINITY_DN1379_c1_g2_i3.p1 TRINITY_DN1379_c1_g2~~TRINITY_DN1379_c1_g2_i3.p1  ORF type:complete len:647 (+),score=75.37 TRINITY_DN1379_c1_g2_i3:256-1941(+)